MTRKQLAKKRRGAPRKYGEARVAELKAALAAYITKEAVPIVAEFAYLNNVERTSLYAMPELSTLLKKLIDKKEAQLEKGALGNKFNPAMAIFSLKQMGWRDKHDVDLQGEVTINIGLPEEMVK